MTVATDFRELMRLAWNLGKAKKSGNKKAIEKAQNEHDSYRDLCLKADQMNLGCTYGALDSPENFQVSL